MLPTENATLRRALDHWFEETRIRPRVVGEFEDSALLKVFGQSGLGLFAAPVAVEPEILKSGTVRVVGRPRRVRTPFYAISMERKVRHPAVVAITGAARNELFA